MESETIKEQNYKFLASWDSTVKNKNYKSIASKDFK
jgi:hypothetical protein